MNVALKLKVESEFIAITSYWNLKTIFFIFLFDLCSLDLENNARQIERHT